MLETPKVAVLRGMAICAATHVCGEELLYDSAAALERIYAINPRKISLDEARTR